MKPATVQDLIDALTPLDRTMPVAIEDGEWGPLACKYGVEVRVEMVHTGEAQTTPGEYEPDKWKLTAIIDHKDEEL